MAFDLHKNFAISQIATAPSPATTGTSLTVTSGQGAWFPAPPFNATIWPSQGLPLSTNAEIVRVTAISTDTITITRTQEGSTARNIVVGDQICATTTNKVLTDIENSVLGGSFTGNYPNPQLASGAAATNIGAVGGDLAKSTSFSNMLYRPQSAGITTSLPASPIDGQIAYVLNSSNRTWRFRYNANYSGANKWEFLGGGALFNACSNNPSGVTYTGAGFGSWFGFAMTPGGTNLLSLHIPWAGQYYVWTGGSIYATVVNLDFRGNLGFVPTSGSFSNLNNTHRLSCAPSYNGFNVSNAVIATVGSSGTLYPQWSTPNAQTIIHGNPSGWNIYVLPIRVSG